MKQLGMAEIDESWSFGERLKYFRKRKGLSQVKLSSGICTNSHVSMMEADQVKPSAKIAMALAERLGVDVNWLLPVPSDEQKNAIEIQVFERIEFFVESHQWEKAYELAKAFEGFSEFKMTNLDCARVVSAIAMYRAVVEKKYSEALEIVEVGLRVVAVDKLPRSRMFQVEGHVHRMSNNWHAAYISYRMGMDTLGTYTGRTFAELSYHIGVACNMVGRNSEASLNLKNAYMYYSGFNDLRAQANVLYSLGVASNSRTILQEAMELYKQVNDQKMLLILREAIAFQHTAKEDHNSAVISLISVGAEFAEKKDEVNALHNFSLALRIAVEHQDVTLADVVKAKIMEVQGSVVETEVAKAESYLALAKYEYGIASDITKAKRYGVLAGELFYSNGMEQDAKMAYSLAAKCCEALGEYQEAFKLIQPFVEDGGEKHVS